MKVIWDAKQSLIENRKNSFTGKNDFLTESGHFQKVHLSKDLLKVYKYVLGESFIFGK